MTKEEHILEEKGINPTAIRILVLREILGMDRAFSLGQIEERIGTVDKSTLFRTLQLFHEHHLLHTIDDGSGSLKYSVCSDLCCSSHYDDLHPHFYCQKCGDVICLRANRVPPIQLPEGFLLSNVNFVLKGVCQNCNSKGK